MRKPSAPWVGATTELTPVLLDRGCCCPRAATRSVRVSTFAHLLIWPQGLLLANSRWNPGEGARDVRSTGFQPHPCVDRMMSPERAPS